MATALEQRATPFPPRATRFSGDRFKPPEQGSFKWAAAAAWPRLLSVLSDARLPHPRLSAGLLVTLPYIREKTSIQSQTSRLPSLAAARWESERKEHLLQPVNGGKLLLLLLLPLVCVGSYRQNISKHGLLS